MKRTAFLLIILLLLACCAPYVPTVTSSVCVFNETGYELQYRVYRADSEIIPPYRKWKTETSGYMRLDLETDYKIDAYLIGPEKEVVKDSLIYNVREIFAESSYLFNSGSELFDMKLTYADEHINFEIKPRN